MWNRAFGHHLVISMELPHSLHLMLGVALKENHLKCCKKALSTHTVAPQGIAGGAGRPPSPAQAVVKPF